MAVRLIGRTATDVGEKVDKTGETKSREKSVHSR